MRREKLLLSLGLVLAMLALVVGCAAPATTPTPTPTSTPTATAKPTATATPTTTATSTPTATPKPTTTATPTPTGKVALRMGTQLAGSTTFITGAAVSKLVGKYVPNTSMDVVAVPANDIIMKMLSTGGLELGQGETTTIYEAAFGVGGYADGKMPARLLFGGQETVFQWYTINTKIQTLADFKGRAIEYLNPGAQVRTYLNDATFEWLYNTYGFSPRDVKALEWTSAAKANQDLIAGTADVATTLAKAGSALLELATRYSNFHIIPYPDAAASYVIQKYPAFSKTVVSPGTYGKYPTADVQTIGSRGTYYARADLSDDTVYQIVKAVFDHLSEFQGMLSKAVAADFSLQTAVGYPVAPFHPGAIRYYKEKGVWTADLEKKQAEMLAKIGATR